MTREKRTFQTHRCGSMPSGFSIRRYADDGKPYQWPEPGGWVLGKRASDDDWWVDYLEHITPWKKQHIRFCPWCGERLEAGE